MRTLLHRLNFITLHPSPCLLSSPPLPYLFQAWNSGPTSPRLGIHLAAKAEMREHLLWIRRVSPGPCSVTEPLHDLEQVIAPLWALVSQLRVLNKMISLAPLHSSGPRIYDSVWEGPCLGIWKQMTVSIDNGLYLEGEKGENNVSLIVNHNQKQKDNHTLATTDLTEEYFCSHSD